MTYQSIINMSNLLSVVFDDKNLKYPHLTLVFRLYNTIYNSLNAFTNSNGYSVPKYRF